MEGTVYVLTNPAMPDLVKIRKTTRDVFDISRLDGSIFDEGQIHM